MTEKDYRIYTSPSEVHKAFNSLTGIIEGIMMDSVVHQKEIQELEMWTETHSYLLHKNPFNDIITNIQVIISDNIITPEEVADMRWVCEHFADGFDYYDKNTSDLQHLQGLCHGILSDGIIKDTEVIALKEWLDNHSHLATYYPYDEILSLLTDVLVDQKVDDNERTYLKKFFSDFVLLNDAELSKQIKEDTKDVVGGAICAMDPVIDFAGKQFCFTGHSSRDGIGKKEIGLLIESLDGIFKNNVSSKTDYLIVGDNGNECWAFACYGRKVEQAFNMRKKGQQILIVHENDFWDAIEDADMQVEWLKM